MKNVNCTTELVNTTGHWCNIARQNSGITSLNYKCVQVGSDHLPIVNPITDSLPKCISTDGKNCSWGIASREACIAFSESFDYNRLIPVSCTTSQINTPGHWCQISLNS